MNLNFEKDALEIFTRDLDIIYEDDLTTLKGMKLAIDATVLLQMAAGAANPHKFMQDGGAALDLALQQKLVEIITNLKKSYN